MTAQASKNARPRRNEEMKFAYEGPFVRLLDPIRPVKPVRGPSGIVLRKQPRYAPFTAESWSIQSRLMGTLRGVVALTRMEDTFGREYGSVLS